MSFLWRYASGAPMRRGNISFPSSRRATNVTSWVALSRRVRTLQKRWRGGGAQQARGDRSATLASEGCSRGSFLFWAAVTDALYPQIRKHNTPPFAQLMNILI